VQSVVFPIRWRTLNSRTPRTLTIASYALLLGLVAYSTSFVLRHGHVVRNRFTDAWWHIAAAEEYARTGVFAKDPFFKEAPPFAQFGLMEFANARITHVASSQPEAVYVLLIAVQAAVFLLATFAAGTLAAGRAWGGAVCMGVSAAMFGHHGVIGLGLPIVTALGLWTLLCAILWRKREASIAARNRQSSFGGLAMTSGITTGDFRCLEATLPGLLAGAIFDLHAFAGVASVVAVAVTYGGEGVRDMRYRRTRLDGLCRLGSNAALFAVPFLLLAWPWIVHHAALRPVLARHNAHLTMGTGIAWRPVFPILVGLAILGLGAWIRGRFGASERPVSRFLPYGLLAATLLLLCLPPVNGLIRQRMGGFMAERVPAFFPLGLVTAVGVRAMTSARIGRLARGGLVLVVLGLAGVFAMPGAGKAALLQRYLTLGQDYEQHPQQHLRAAAELGLGGATVLSDPWTSYHARGLLGAYAVTVPAGHASPAVDYEARDHAARTALAHGPAAVAGFNVNAVIVNKRNDRTERFCGVATEEIPPRWQASGWDVVLETAELAVLMQAEGGG